MAKITNMLEVAIADIVPYEHNAKLHGPEQTRQIAESIKAFGFLVPCLIDEHNNLIAGHGRIAAARLLGLEKVPCIRADGLTDAQRRAFILADNRLTELGGWDTSTISAELKRLQDEGFDIELTGFTEDDIELDEDGTFEVDAPADYGDAPAEIVKPGQLLQLGEHRLLCGDSTKPEDVALLMGDDVADLLLTDPPYNVRYQGRRTKRKQIENDEMGLDEYQAFLDSALINGAERMKPGAAFYVWYPGMFGPIVQNALNAAGLHAVEILIWVKSNFVISWNDYHWQHEPCLYGWKPGAGHYFTKRRNMTGVCETPPPDLDGMTREQLLEFIRGLYDQTTVIHEAKPDVSDLHPTTKPEALFARCVKNSTRAGETVLDLFGGSGTSLAVCESLGRRCRMMELDPHYAGVIVARWQEMTGKTAVILRG